MIELHDVTKIYGRGFGRRIVCDRLSVAFDGSSDVGILGGNGSGKSTLLRMIAGMEVPDSGQIVRRCRVSFPLGYSGGFHPNLSARDNVRFVARLYGADEAATVRFVQDFSEVGLHFDDPLYKYSNTMRSRVTFALSIAIEFDLYLVDEVTSVGDVTFKRKCLAALTERRKHARLLMASQHAHTVSKLCQTGAILDGGQIYAYATMAEAVSVYQNSIVVTDA
jgi:capsular polysaccharide transport system ATP-binding protein